MAPLEFLVLCCFFQLDDAVVLVHQQPIVDGSFCAHAMQPSSEHLSTMQSENMGRELTLDATEIRDRRHLLARYVGVDRLLADVNALLFLGEVITRHQCRSPLALLSLPASGGYRSCILAPERWRG
jgi:hypothetical protein